MKIIILFVIICYIRHNVRADCKNCSHQYGPNCTRTPGEYFDNHFLNCFKCKRCGSGEEVKWPCSSRTKCIQCINGKTFSNKTSKIKGSCQPCQGCQYGFIRECNLTSDNICKAGVSTTNIVPNCSLSLASTENPRRNSSLPFHPDALLYALLYAVGLAYVLSDP